MAEILQKVTAWSAALFGLLIIGLIASSPLRDITGGVTYSGGGHSCTVSTTGKTYQKCMFASLGKRETILTSVPWASKTITGAVGFIRDYVPGAKVNPQVSAWIDLTDWLNNKIYDLTPNAFKNLGRFAKKDGTVKILIGWNYKITDSAWGRGWKWVEVSYDYYYEDNQRNFQPYEKSSAGFYYNPKDNGVSH